MFLCKLKVELTSFDQTILDENQHERAHRIVQVTFPFVNFSHLLSVHMRSAGKKDCKMPKKRENLIKKGKKKKSLSLMIRCAQTVTN